MSDNAIPKTGSNFMIGVGPVGAMLLDIASGLCLRIDDARWSMNALRGNVILSHKRVERLIEAGWVVIPPEKIMDREQLLLTTSGRDEAIAWSLVRSRELADDNDPPAVVIDEGRQAFTTQGRVYDLAEKSFEMQATARLVAGEDYAAVRGGGTLTIKLQNGELIDVADYLKQPDHVLRASRLFDLIGQLADAAMYGLTIGDMSSFARWGGTIAAERFERAPDQDWEVGGDEE